MPQSLSNKVEKPLVDINSIFGAPKKNPFQGGSQSTSSQTTTPSVATSANVSPIFRPKTDLPSQFTQPLYSSQNQSVKQNTGVQTQTQQPTQQDLMGQLQGAQTLLNQKTNGNTQVPTIQQPAQGVKGLLPTTPPTPTQQGNEKPTFSGILFDLIKKATDEDKNVSDATKNAQGINEQIQKQRQELAEKVGGIQNKAIPLEFQQGQQQVLQSQGADILAGLGEQYAGATNLLNSATTQRQQTLNALEGAAGMAQPSPSAYGQTTFNPLEGGFSGGGGLPQDVMQHYAQMAASGQYSAIPSFITSNPVLNAQLNVAAKTFNPNFTPVGAQGASEVIQTLPALKSAETAAEGIKNTIVSYIDQNPQLNPSDLAAGNQLQQWIQGKQLTDPKYQTLFNYLNEYTNTLAPILGVGGSVTNLKTEIAQSFVNAAASGKSISEVLGTISSLAKNKVTDLERGALGQGTSVPAGGLQGGFAETW